VKKREIEKLIKMEINNATPHRAKEICGEKRVNRFFSFKRIGLIGSFAVMLCMCIILPLAINNNKQSGFALADAGTIVLDINPSLELTYNKKGKITQIKGLNEDGRILTANNDYTGKNYKKVIEELIADCTDLGYFSKDRENNAILITAMDSKGNQYHKFNKELEKKFEKSFTDFGLNGVVICDTELKGNQIDGLTVQKSSLINTIVSLTGESIEEYLDKSISELYEILEEEKYENLNEDLIEELEEVIEEIQSNPLKQDLLNLLSYINLPNDYSKEQITFTLTNVITNPEFISVANEDLIEEIMDFYKHFKKQNFTDEIIDDKKDFYNPNKGQGQGQGKPQNPPQQSNSNHKPPKNEDDFLNDWFNLKNEWFNDMDNEFNFFD